MVSLGFTALMLTFGKLPESSFSLDFRLKVGKKGQKERREGGREERDGGKRKRKGGETDRSVSQSFVKSTDQSIDE